MTRQQIPFRASMFAAAASFAYAKVCSPATCVDGNSSSRLLANDKERAAQLLPGSYASSQYDPEAPFNGTVNRTSSTVVVNSPDCPVSFSNANYTGAASALTVAPGNWSSLFIPSGWYASVPSFQVLHSSIPDRDELPQVYDIMGFANANCEPPCSSNGICIGSSKDAQCHCKEGWTGPSCDGCSVGYFGSECKACPADCPVCDDGLAGSGLCLGALTDPSACNCGFGFCLNSTECECAPGRITKNNSSLKCNACASGFYETRDKQCDACPLGCTTCELRAGGSSPTCTACSRGLELSSKVPTTCEPPFPCGTRTFYDSSAKTCIPCSPACQSCTGPSEDDCIGCALPRSALAGQCVPVDGRTGVCRGTNLSLGQGYVRDNSNGQCKTCPPGCRECSIPNFSAVATVDNAVCSSCQDGFALRNGSCVSYCGAGWFLSAATSSCEACESSCKNCAGKAGYCLQCAAGLASNGRCVDHCPEHTFRENGTCSQCHPDCSTCTDSSASSCLSCPPSRPLLQDGRCLPFCPQGQYAVGSECAACDENCASCTARSSCTSCGDGYVLKAGVCVAVACAFAPSLGICLNGFIDQMITGTAASAAATSEASTRPYLAPLAALAALVLVMGFFALYVHRQRRRTRERTAEFARQMDENAVGRRLHALEAQERVESKKGIGLKDLWLKNRARVARPRSFRSSHSTGNSWASAAPDAVPMQHLSQSARIEGFGHCASNTARVEDPSLRFSSQSAPSTTSDDRPFRSGSG